MYFLKKKYVWAVGYSLLLIAFTLYVVLDTFVISRAYSVVSNTASESTEARQETKSEVQTELDSSDIETSELTENEDSKFTDSGVIGEDYYRDENITIAITEYREYETAIYVADVTISSAEYLKTALAQSTYGRNITDKTSKIASDSNAILAINGDFYGSQTKGYVLRNGVLYMDGIISVSEDEEVGKAKASNPRTAIGLIDDLHYLFVVSDGRTSESEGLSLYQLADFMTGLGADIAYNLDGGGSSTMYFNGQVINNPTTNGKSIKERSVSDIVYIGY